MSADRTAYIAVVQDGEGVSDQETELVTIEGDVGPGCVIELTDGRRITLVEPTAKEAA